MFNALKIRNIFAVAFLSAVLMIFIAPDMAEARRGGGRSFGGSRRSTRVSRPSSSRRTARPMTPKQRAAKRQQTIRTQKRTPAFGGKRMSSSAARKKYGPPRKTESFTGKNAYGGSQNYTVHHYGGYSSGLMQGYMMGSITSSMMWMPWRGAYWYSRPYYTEPDQYGNIGVYPPTFNWTKFFVTIIIFIVIIMIIRALIRGRRSGSNSGSFG